MDRRTLLRGSAAAATTAFLGGPFQGFIAHAAVAAPKGNRGRGAGGPLSYGPLAPVPDAADGVERLQLPRGFRYRSFEPTGAQLTDGSPVPGRHDGMGAFKGPKGHSVLVRNHEVNGPVGAFGDRALAYDVAAGGGTTTVIVDGRGRVQRSFVSANGTMMNCSGGQMPWGTWATCEETVNGPDVGNDFTGGDNSQLTKPHGYVFEVPLRGRDVPPEPIRNAGRFAHEAIAYDRRTDAFYLTEDNFGFPSGFYRYLPPTSPRRAKRIVDGGELQMLKVRGRDGVDLSGEDGDPPAVGATFDVEWVTIPDPDPSFAPGTTNNEAIQAVGQQGRDQGAAIFSRLEGAVADGNTVFFVSTQGGAQPDGASDPSGFGKGRGQIWAYHTPTSRLRLVYESPSADVLDFPDNITTSRSNTLVLCEDGGDGNFLRGLTTDGAIFDFAKNDIADREDDEFAGSTFSPDHKTLFVNIQARSGLTFAIWGPWGRGGF